MKKKESLSVEVIETSTETEEPKKKGKLRSLPTKAKIGYSCLIVGFLAIGALGGIVLGKRIFAEQEIDYGDPNSFEDDFEVIKKKFEKLDTNNNLSNSLESYEMVNIAVHKYMDQDYTFSEQFGEVAAMGSKTTIRASAIKNKDKFFLENISNSGLSLAKAARRFYQSGDEVENYNGSKIEEVSASWSLEETKSVNEHTEKWGKDLSRPLIYIISSKTVKEGSSITLDGDTYKVKMDLDKDLAPIRYKLQMHSISGVTNVHFDSIHIEFDIDKNINLKYFIVKEKYEVTMGMFSGVSSTGELEEYFTYGTEKQLPQVNENVIYNKEDLL